MSSKKTILLLLPPFLFFFSYILTSNYIDKQPTRYAYEVLAFYDENDGRGGGGYRECEGLVYEDTISYDSVGNPIGSTSELKYAIYDSSRNWVPFQALSIKNDGGIEGQPFVYFVDINELISIYDLDTSIPCPTVPGQINSLLAEQSQTLYPVNLSATEFEGEYLRQGESYILEVQAVVGEAFITNVGDREEKDLIQLGLLISEGELEPIGLSLKSTHFSVLPRPVEQNSQTLSTPDNESGPIPFGLNRPVMFSWIISPVENALGKQVISVDFITYNEDGSREIYRGPTLIIEVRKIDGLDPIIISVLVTIFFTLTTMFGFFKDLPDFVQTLKSFWKVKKDKPIGFSTKSDKEN